MSRIRSVHPGIWTDEDFVALSMAARLFLIGLWGEADDYGVFEWKPLRLKMRLAPIDDVDAAALLGEIAQMGQIVAIVRNEKRYGVIKNFRKYQRPKNPSAPLIPLDREINLIVGLPAGDSPTPALPQEQPSPPEIPPQMEDGIGGDIHVGGSARARLRSLGDRVMGIMGVRDDPRWLGNYSLIEVWLERGFDPDLDICPTIEVLMAKRGGQGPPGNLKYFDRAIAQAHADRTRILPEAVNGTRHHPAKPRRTEESDRSAIVGAFGFDAPANGMEDHGRFGGEIIEGDYHLGDQGSEVPA
jgi:hypothetical protein